MDFILTQIIGGIGYSILAYSYYKKKKDKILLTQIIAYIMFIIHYYRLNGITGAWCNFIVLIAFIIIYLLDKYKVKYKEVLSLGMIPLMFILILTTYKNAYSIFPIIASIIVVISFVNNNEKIIRLIGIVAAICWLIYAIVYHSYVAIVFEILTLIFVVIAFFKHNK